MIRRHSSRVLLLLSYVLFDIRHIFDIVGALHRVEQTSSLTFDKLSPTGRIRSQRSCLLSYP